MKEQTDKLDYINMKNCAPKDVTNKVKKLTCRMGEIFADHISQNGLTFRKYKELLLTKKTQTTQLKNGQNT